MRDIAFVLCFIPLLFLAIKRPFIALSLWMWTGLFVPRHWLYGFAASYSYNTVYAACTMLGYVVYKHKPKFKSNIVFALVILFFLHTTLTSSATILVYTEYLWRSWENFFKAILLFVFACLILRDKHQFNYFIWGIVLSVGFLGLVEGLKFINSGGTHHIKGPNGNILSDNNHMAVAMCMALPLMAYLVSVTRERLIRIALTVIIAVTVLSILGTHSRGGLLGLLIVGGYFWMNSKSKFKSLIGIVTIVFIANLFLPISWFTRMDSIENPLEDQSFTTRINSWKIHTLMAMERPVLGGGFSACQAGYIWRQLAINVDKVNFISTPPPGPKGWAAHSIYFQVLGDHGFVGLFLFLLLLFMSFVKLVQVEKYYAKQKTDDDWKYRLAKMLKVSLIAYCSAGAAVSLAYVELLYGVLAIICCLCMSMQLEVESKQKL